MREVKVGQMHSGFPRAFKAAKESDISVFVKGGIAHLHHDSGAELFTISKFSRPAMWITQSSMWKIHWHAFTGQFPRGVVTITSNPPGGHPSLDFLIFLSGRNPVTLDGQKLPRD
jgi:hypothetical protein